MRTIELLAPAKNYECGCAAVDCRSRRVVRRCARFRRAGRCGRSGRRHRAVVRLCAPFWRTGVRDDEYVGFRRRTARGRTHRPRSMPLGRRCADRAGYGVSADGSSPVELHASTQMYDDSRSGAVLERSRFSRIILERAATLAEIREIANAVPDTGIEAFVHGAICVAYSGQCYLSRSMSPRSGNRGACLQACRLPYDLVDENGKRLMSGKHLLSLRDLNLFATLGQHGGCGRFVVQDRRTVEGYQLRA